MILSPHVEVFRYGPEKRYAFRFPSVKTAVLSVPAPNLQGKAHGQPRASSGKRYTAESGISWPAPLFTDTLL